MRVDYCAGDLYVLFFSLIIYLSLFTDKLGPITMVYKCPMQTCSDEFEEKTQLALHLDEVHPQYGSACATQVQPTPSARPRPPGSNHNVADMCHSGPSSVDSPIIVGGKAASRSNFFFLAPPTLRFSRRLAAPQKKPSWRRRPFQEITGPDESAVRGKLTANPDLVKRLTPLVYRNKDVINRPDAIKRLKKIIGRLSGSNEGTDEIDAAPKWVPHRIHLTGVITIKLLLTPDLPSFF